MPMINIGIPIGFTASGQNDKWSVATDDAMKYESWQKV